MFFVIFVRLPCLMSPPTEGHNRLAGFHLEFGFSDAMKLFLGKHISHDHFRREGFRNEEL